jgi:glycosyltransferase involved in cell wall biosynthesis
MMGNLSPLNNLRVPEQGSEIRLFAVMRNEALRIPFFLNHYSEQGVERFFIVDDNSTDGSVDLLLAHERVHVFRAAETYSQSRCGVDWIETLLGCYGEDHWCVVADADEILVYPGWESISLPQLSRYFDSERVSAFHCLLVDMYSDRPFDETEYVPGTNPLKACPYYESETIWCSASLHGAKVGKWRHTGGMRRRLFGLHVCLDKISFIKYTPAMTLQPGMHGIEGALFSKVRGAMLHFKFFADFSAKASVEASRGEHWDNAIQYKRYSEIFTSDQHLCAYSSASRRLSATTDLIKSDIMRCPEEFARYFSLRTDSSVSRKTLGTPPMVGFLQH